MNNQYKENLHIGSSFDDFLTEEAILEEVTAVATKRVIAWQISEGMSSLKLSKTAMAKKMHTSRACRQHSSHQKFRVNPATDIPPVTDKIFLQWFV
jgi:hypothetical protein